MAGYGAFQFSNPSEYGDWAQYAGFNRRTGEMDASSVSPGVKPPEDFQQYMSSRMDEAKSKMGAVVPALVQASEGNMLQAARTLRNAQPVATIQSPQAPMMPTMDTGYDYTFGL